MQDIPSDSISNQSAKAHQKKLLIALTIFFVIAILCFTIYWFLHARYFQDTDNAYVNGNIVPISAQINGNIIALNVDDTDFVQAGDVLLRLDPTDSKIALVEAEARLAQAIRQAQQLFINNNGLKAIIQARQSDVQKANKDLTRRQKAITAGAISLEELTNAEESYHSATASLTRAQSDLQANYALTLNTTATAHPLVLQAIVGFRRAWLDYMRTTIRAPVAGYVSKRSAQIGQRVSPGQLLMAIVPLDQVWVDANFKEKQLQKMHTGQPVLLTADMYGQSVIYHGYIAGFAAGTGSAFALLPAQNATGNWIKIVQRLPVRIALTASELKLHPLRIGLSMNVEVDTHNQTGSVLEVDKQKAYKTTIFDNLDQQADAIIAKIIKDNLVTQAGACHKNNKTGFC